MNLTLKWQNLLPVLIEAASRDTLTDARSIARHHLLMLARAADETVQPVKVDPVNVEDPAYQLGYEHGFSGEQERCPDKFTSKQRALYGLAYAEGVADYVENIWVDK